MRYKISSSTKSIIDEGELILLNMKNGKFYGCDTISTEILDAVNEGLCVGDIVGRLQQKYEVDEERLHNDVNSLLNLMERNGLVKRV